MSPTRAHRDPHGRAERASTARLRSWGVPMDGVRPLDGSGLSLDNRVTCAAMLAVLQHVGGRRRCRPDCRSPGGPARWRRSSSARPSRVDSMAKTGTLGNPPVTADPPSVKALSGYLPGGERRRRSSSR